MTELEIKEQMCEVGRRVYNKGMVAANDGTFRKIKRSRILMHTNRCK